MFMLDHMRKMNMNQSAESFAREARIDDTSSGSYSFSYPYIVFIFVYSLMIMLRVEAIITPIVFIQFLLVIFSMYFPSWLFFDLHVIYCKGGRLAML